MNEERNLAKEKGYESPIHENIEETHNCYNTNLKILVANLRPKDRLFIGSHNLESVELAKKLIKENPATLKVTFGQLKGFSDQITGSLANEGFAVAKYLPYGPTDTVMPYLVRRG
jgi:proline dehydrogenase